MGQDNEEYASMEIADGDATAWQLQRRRWFRGTRILALYLPLALLLGGPLYIAGFIAALLGELLQWPVTYLVTTHVMPYVVDLWYVHRIGRLHIWLSKKQSPRRDRPHSRFTRTDVIVGDGLCVSVFTLACLLDNYCYLLVPLLADGRPGLCALVDCGDADMVVNQMAEVSRIHCRGVPLRVAKILITHHHWDHMDGAKNFQKCWDQKFLDSSGEACASAPAKIVGGVHERFVTGATERVADGEVIEPCPGVRLACLETPGHTRGSLMYLLQGVTDSCLFTGDTLFLGGSGAPFETSKPSSTLMASQFLRLEATFGSSLRNTLLFTGHEYTERILAQITQSSQGTHLIHTNPQAFMTLAAAWARARHLRSLAYPAPTVPFLLQEELAYSPEFSRGRWAADVLRRVWVNGTRKSCVPTLSTAASSGSHKTPSGQTTATLTTTTTALSVEKPERGGSAPRTFLVPRISLDTLGREIVLEPPWVTTLEGCQVQTIKSLLCSPGQYPPLKLSSACPGAKEVGDALLMCSWRRPADFYGPLRLVYRKDFYLVMTSCRLGRLTTLQTDCLWELMTKTQAHADPKGVDVRVGAKLLWEWCCPTIEKAAPRANTSANTDAAADANADAAADANADANAIAGSNEVGKPGTTNGSFADAPLLTKKTTTCHDFTACRICCALPLAGLTPGRTPGQTPRHAVSSHGRLSIADSAERPGGLRNSVEFGAEGVPQIWEPQPTPYALEMRRASSVSNATAWGCNTTREMPSLSKPTLQTLQTLQNLQTQTQTQPQPQLQTPEGYLRVGRQPSAQAPQPQSAQPHSAQPHSAQPQADTFSEGSAKSKALT